MCSVSDWPLCLPVVPKCTVNVLFHDVFVNLWLDTISQSLDFEQVSPPGCTFFCRCRLHSTSCWLTELCDFSRRTMTVSNCGLLSWCLLENSCYQHRRLALVNVFHHILCTDVYVFSSVAIYSFFRWYFTPIYRNDYAIFSFPLPASLCFSVFLFVGSRRVWFLSFSFLQPRVLFFLSLVLFLFLFFCGTFLAYIRKY